MILDIELAAVGVAWAVLRKEAKAREHEERRRAAQRERLRAGQGIEELIEAGRIAGAIIREGDG